MCCGERYLERTFHHIYTRGARPDLAEEQWNKIPLCFSCHARWHNVGTSAMAGSSEEVKGWLLENGWELDCYLGKWINEKAMQRM